MSEDPEWLRDARRNGLVITERGAGSPPPVPTVGPLPKRERPELVAAAFTPPATFVVPLHVAPGDNARGARARIGRAGHERRAVARVLGRHLAALAPLGDRLHGRGERLVVRFTRLGGRGVDPDSLPACFKYPLDIVCLFYGIDDNAKAPLRVEYHQEPGGASGVRIELATEAVPPAAPRNGGGL